MTDLAIDPDTGDLVYEDGDFAEVSELDEMRQKVELKIGLVQGEWFFNRALGVPYYSRIFGQTKSDPISVNTVFTQAILSIPGISKLIEPIDYVLNKINRSLSLSFKAKTESGILDMTIEV